jgi:hypothetical protein
VHGELCGFLCLKEQNGHGVNSIVSVPLSLALMSLDRALQPRDKKVDVVQRGLRQGVWWRAWLHNQIRDNPRIRFKVVTQATELF